MIAIATARGAADAKADDMIGAMIEAQNDLGVPGSSMSEWKRVAVADLDTLDARAAFDLAAWAAGHIA